MKVIEWNINQRSNYKNKNHIPDYISKEINKENADIVILTEFYKTSRWEDFATELQSYNIFSTDNSKEGQNDILIAIKKKYTIKGINDKEFSDSNTKPDYLRVDMEYEGNTVSIIGTRIRINPYVYNDIKAMEIEMEFRKKQFEMLIKEVTSLENSVIGAGDFNNNRRNTKNNTWNLEILKNTFDNNKFNLNTPSGSSFDPLSKSEFALDHLFTSKDIVVKNSFYSWSFIWSHDIYENGKRYKVDNPFPDHAILIANIDIPV